MAEGMATGFLALDHYSKIQRQYSTLSSQTFAMYQNCHCSASRKRARSLPPLYGSDVRNLHGCPMQSTIGSNNHYKAGRYNFSIALLLAAIQRSRKAPLQINNGIFFVRGGWLVCVSAAICSSKTLWIRSVLRWAGPGYFFFSTGFQHDFMCHALH